MLYLSKVTPRQNLLPSCRTPRFPWYGAAHDCQLRAPGGPQRRTLPPTHLGLLAHFHGVKRVLVEKLMISLEVEPEVHTVLPQLQKERWKTGMDYCHSIVKTLQTSNFK